MAVYIGEPKSRPTLLSRRLSHPAAVDPNGYAGVLADPQLKCGRKNIVQLNAGERALLAKAMNELYEVGIIDDLADEHADDWYHIHFGAAFFPWHRHFVWRMERHLQAYDSRLYVPYWDWTREDSQDLDKGVWKSFFGGRSGEGGLLKWKPKRYPDDSYAMLPTVSQVLGALKRTTFEDFRRIEVPEGIHAGHHAGPHLWVGGPPEYNGHMTSHRAPYDPLFYLHHCNLDRLWAIWQRLYPEAEQYPSNGGDASPGYDSDVKIDSVMAGGRTPRSMLDHTALGIIYREDPVLEADWANDPDTAGSQLPSGDVTRRMRAIPSRLNFGIISVGHLRARAVTLRNSGTLPVKVSVADQQGPIWWHGLKAEIQPCNAREVPVFYQPTQPSGTDQAELVVETNAQPARLRVLLYGSNRDPNPEGDPWS